MALTSGMYVGGLLYSGGQPVIDDLRASGLTTVVGWTVTVSETGDLGFYGNPIVAGGSYIGDPSWPARLASLKQAPTSVNRLIFSVGSADMPVYAHIQQLIKAYGTGPTSPLYQSFAALLTAIPTVDAVDLNDEDVYDAGTIVSFSQMLATIGYKHITFCPYINPSFWVGCLKTLEASNPGLVTQFNLHIYGVASGTNPQDWIDAIATVMGPSFPSSSFVFPGLWCRHTAQNGNPGDCNEGNCPGDVESRFADWSSSRLQGGWIWFYDELVECVRSNACYGQQMTSAAYASAVLRGLRV